MLVVIYSVLKPHFAINDFARDSAASRDSRECGSVVCVIERVLLQQLVSSLLETSVSMVSQLVHPFLPFLVLDAAYCYRRGVVCCSARCWSSC